VQKNRDDDDNALFSCATVEVTGEPDESGNDFVSREPNPSRGDLSGEEGFTKETIVQKNSALFSCATVEVSTGEPDESGNDYEKLNPKVENIRHIYRQLKGARKGTDQEKENTRQFIENMKQKKDFSSISTNDLTIYAIHNVFKQMGIDVCLTDSKLESDESLALHSRVWLSGLLDLKIYETKFESNGVCDAKSINSNKDFRSRFISEFKNFLCGTTLLPGEAINVIEIKEGSVAVIYSVNAQLDLLKLNQSVNNAKTPFNLKYLGTNRCGLLDSLLISKDIFDPGYDMDYTSSNFRGLIHKRGGEDYHFPFGWKRMALKMSSFGFTDLSWLTMNGGENEWSMAYHGIRYDPKETLKKIIDDSSGRPTLKPGVGQACGKLIDINKRGKGYGKECGVGIYCTNKIETAEGYTSQVDLNGKKVKLALQCRINPEKFRNSGHIDNGGYFYVINDSNDIRPYGILLNIS
jgi:hypothetical protein